MKISIIIPCFNVEKYIDRCLDSVISQTFPLSDIEIICVDDHSEDSTYEKLLVWEKTYPDNFILVRLEINSGQSTARNIGLSYASGDYVAFLDSDDWIEENYIESMYEKAAQEGSDIVQTEFIRDDGNICLNALSGSSSSSVNSETFDLSDVNTRKKVILDKKISSNAPFKLIKRSLLTENNIFFYDGLKYEDISFGLLLSLYSKKLTLLHQKSYHYFINPNSTVLKKNQTYHIDIITGWSILWADLSARGFMEEYKEELEIEFVYSCILIFWKCTILRFDTPPYSYYRLLCEFVKNTIPDLENNKYIKAGILAEHHRLLLSGCYNILNNQDFKKLCDSVVKIGL
ncbi:MAG: glycosyltransferase family 2 protein [Butyrivibrio sp.]|uniref:glycosyltransferase family 2 protein n=1 Tax=Butyrivibrio sp. TaxID=28121 RepID=UPI001B152E09|nr:glycosyltransferase family 2 protein [Butyrivibrio sp.]MBO6241733.1 glycosyltransferase family 2 protein [Butyrivibrio sp.]